MTRIKLNVSYGIFLVCALVLGSPKAFSQTKHDDSFHGSALYQTVEKFVSLGEHRTGTPGDFATSAWLGKELSASGYKVEYVEFSMKQFFPESISVKDQLNATYKAFPLWYVSDSTKLDVTATLTTNSSALEQVKNKVVLIDFSFDQRGQGGGKIVRRLEELIHAGATAVIGYAPNEANEIVAFNAPKAAKPWKIPVVIVSPGDALKLKSQEGQKVNVSIKGTFKDVKARNVYGTIGTGDRYIVISTPSADGLRVVAKEVLALLHGLRWRNGRPRKSLFIPLSSRVTQDMN